MLVDEKETQKGFHHSLKISSPPSNIMFDISEINDLIFFESSHTLAMICIKPILPGKSRSILLEINQSIFISFLGHVLVFPKRKILKFTEFSIEELIDLFQSVQKIEIQLEKEVI